MVVGEHLWLSEATKEVSTGGRGCFNGGGLEQWQRSDPRVGRSGGGEVGALDRGGGSRITVNSLEWSTFVVGLSSNASEVALAENSSLVSLL